jgi:hypothetical protein
MGLSTDLLDALPVTNFVLSGLFLVIVMGIIPFVIAFGLWKRYAWSWMAALAESIILILWICFQIILWGNPIAIQIIYLLWGIMMLGLCFAPGIRSYRRNKQY